MNYSPRMEKKIMKPADIWTTLRLPTRVNANKPAFSLKITKNDITVCQELIDKNISKDLVI